MKIALIGHIHFAKKLADNYNILGHPTITLDYGNWGRKFYKSISDIKSVDIIHFLGGVGIRKFVYIFVIKYLFKKKIFVHFVGSDVTRLIKCNMFDKINWILALKLADRVFCVSEWLNNELKPYVKNTETFPIFFNNLKTKIYKFPKSFTILCYLPESRPEFYGESQIETLVKNNPKIKFIIFGGLKLKIYPNVKCVNIDYNLDMRQYYIESSLLVRLTQHDGLSNMVLESLAMNRHVIWTNKFPFVNHVNNYSKNIQSIIEALITTKENKGASEWISSNFNHDKLVDNLLSLYTNPKKKVSNVFK